MQELEITILRVRKNHFGNTVTPSNKNEFITLIKKAAIKAGNHYYALASQWSRTVCFLWGQNDNRTGPIFDKNEIGPEWLGQLGSGPERPGTI